jgi:PAS domain S-box-containing protein
MAFICVMVFTASTDQWVAFVPIAFLFPPLLVVAARCRPEFAAGAASIIAFSAILTTSYDIGRFGDPSVAIAQRVQAAQFATMVTTLCALVLAALFAERRRTEARLTFSNDRLKDSRERLLLALSGAKLGAFSVDLPTGRLDCDLRTAHIHGHSVLPKTIVEGQRFIHADDVARVEACLAQAQLTGSTCSTQYRVVPPPSHGLAGQVRWIALEGTIVHDGRGIPARLLCVTRDITESKNAEVLLRKQLDVERRVLAEISAGVPISEVFDDLMRTVEEGSDDDMVASIFLIDKDGRHLVCASAPGLPANFTDKLHGIAIGPKAGCCGTAAFRGEPVIVTNIAEDPLCEDYRTLAADHGFQACWSYPIKAVDGRVLGTVTVYYLRPRAPLAQDMELVATVAHTVSLAIERQSAERALRESQERLSSALNAAGMIGTWDWHIPSDTAYCDARLAALCSVDPKTGETGAPLASYFEAVHPDDIGVLHAAIEDAIATGKIYDQDCRLVQADRTVRWVSARGQCFYDPAGKPIRFLGAVVDITERRRAELALQESEARLQDALAAGRVMAFEWDPHTKLSRRSANASQILGPASGRGTNGRRNEFMVRVHPDDRARFVAHLHGVCPESPNYSMKFRYIRPDGKEVWLEETARAEFAADGSVTCIKGLTRDITERTRAEERQNLLIAELDHRVKNTLTCVSAIAQRSREGSTSMDEFLTVLNGRIQSMAIAHALLSRAGWQGVDLAELVRCELAPCLGSDNVITEGPEVVLAADATQPMAMVLHELVTNATKYGALSTPSGRVSVRWDRPSKARRRRPGLVFEWHEAGGPPVVRPSQAGYGMSVIRDIIPYELGGVDELRFARKGVHCRVEIPDNCIGSGPKGMLISPAFAPLRRSTLSTARMS